MKYGDRCRNRSVAVTVIFVPFGSGFPFAVDEADHGRVNHSGTHVDFMVGSDELDVTGLTASGERVPVLRGGSWQL